MIEGIIITISQKMLKEKGVLPWTRQFLSTMNNPESTYWMRQGACPKRDISYVYLCIGGFVKYRAYFGGTHSGNVELTDADGSVRSMYAKAWIVLAGPVERPSHPIPMRGFRGFRYTEKLF